MCVKRTTKRTTVFSTHGLKIVYFMLSLLHIPISVKENFEKRLIFAPPITFHTIMYTKWLGTLGFIKIHFPLYAKYNLSSSLTFIVLVSFDVLIYSLCHHLIYY